MLIGKYSAAEILVDQIIALKYFRQQIYSVVSFLTSKISDPRYVISRLTHWSKLLIISERFVCPRVQSHLLMVVLSFLSVVVCL